MSKKWFVMIALLVVSVHCAHGADEQPIYDDEARIIGMVSAAPITGMASLWRLDGKDGVSVLAHGGYRYVCPGIAFVAQPIDGQDQSYDQAIADDAADALTYIAATGWTQASIRHAIVHCGGNRKEVKEVVAIAYALSCNDNVKERDLPAYPPAPGYEGA